MKRMFLITRLALATASLALGHMENEPAVHRARG